MKGITITILASLLLSVQALAQDQDAKPGAQTRVAKWEWVKVVNPEPIGTRGRIYGDQCGIERDGFVTIVNRDDDTLLLRYDAPAPARGTPCESGTLFIAYAFWWKSNAEEYKVISDAIEAEKSLVDKLLGRTPSRKQVYY